MTIEELLALVGELYVKLRVLEQERDRLREELEKRVEAELD